MGKDGKRKSGTKRIIKKQCELTEEERNLFNKLIVPKLDFVRSLVKNYSSSKDYVDDTYCICLSEFAYYIKSFNTERMDRLDSWIHVTVKRCCFRQNLKNKTMHENDSGVQLESYLDSTTNSLKSTERTACNSFIDNISDELFEALMQIPYIKLSPFLYYAQGYNLEEIVELEFEKGNLEKKSVYAIKCRVFTAKTMLREILKKNGFKR